MAIRSGAAAYQSSRYSLVLVDGSRSRPGRSQTQRDDGTEFPGISAAQAVDRALSDRQFVDWIAAERPDGSLTGASIKLRDGRWELQVDLEPLPDGRDVSTATVTVDASTSEILERTFPER